MLKKESFKNIINEIEQSCIDIKKRELKNGTEKILFLFVEQLTDKRILAQDFIKPIALCISGKKGSLNPIEVVDSIIYGFDCVLEEKEEKIIEYILDGMTVIAFSNDKRYVVANAKKVENRGINFPELTFTLRGPRDSFNENLDVNLSLIRYRIKDADLKINKFEVGRRTRTRTAVLYIGNIVNEDIVQDITERIKKIDVDGIIDSGEIQNLILNKKMNVFPQMGIVERSDMAAGALLEGKVIVLVEGSALALVAPKMFSEFFASSDDVYDNKFIAVFAKGIRILSSFLSMSITALYIAILNFHIDALPADFIILINNSQQGVPFTIFIGAIIIEILIEMLREALIRVPKQIGPAIGIVGAIVIGQAAIAAKVFSPLMLIVASVSLLSSFTVPDYTIMNPLRIAKIFLILLSATFGLIGFTVGISIIIINIVSTTSFGIPYFAPFAPFNWNDFKNSFFYGKDISPHRPYFLKTKDKFRINKK